MVFRSSPVLIILFTITSLIPLLSFSEGVEKTSSGIHHTQVHRVDASASQIRNVSASSHPPEPGIGQSRSFDKREIRDFVLYNYAHIADNLLNGEGTYLEALFFLMEIKAEEKSVRLSEMRKILMEKEHIPDFSNSIAAAAGEE